MNKWSWRGWLGLAGLAFLAGCQPPPPPVARKAAEEAWTASRTWTAGDGRTLEGALMARMGEAGVVKRTTDGLYFRLTPRMLDEAGARFLSAALEQAGLPTTLADLWHVRLKMTIPGGEAVVFNVDTSIAIGPRIAKQEESYWLLLSELDGSQARWVRVDRTAYGKAGVDVLMPRGEMANQVNGSGRFIDEVPSLRPDMYVADARYGLPSRRLNVTRIVMGLAGEGKLPLIVTPELFGLPPHIPDVWDVNITWQRVGGSAANRVVRDGSVLAWPELPAAN